MTFKKSSTILGLTVLVFFFTAIGCGSSYGTNSDGLASEGTCTCPAGSPTGSVCYCCPDVSTLKISGNNNYTGYLIGTDGTQTSMSGQASLGGQPTGPCQTQSCYSGYSIPGGTTSLSVGQPSSYICNYNTSNSTGLPMTVVTGATVPSTGTCTLPRGTYTPGVYASYSCIGTFADCAMVCTANN